jgi:hypothetical protein
MSTAVQIRQADAEADAAARAAFQREQGGQQSTPHCAVQGCTATGGTVVREGVPYCADHAPILLTDEGVPTSSGWRVVGDRLRRTMPTKERAGRGGNTFQYVTAKQVMERLDEVVGPGNWSTHYFVINPVVPIVECTLTVFGVAKAGAGMCNSPEKPELEAAKSAYSDALKRAAVSWGVGRFIGLDDD